MAPRILRSFLTAFLLAYAATVAAAGAQAMWHREPLDGSLVWRMLTVNPVDFDSWPAYAFMVAMLTVELAIAGWQKSSLRRLLVAPGGSAITDMLYCAITASGLMTVLAALSGFGMGIWLDAELQRHIGTMLSIDWPIWLAVPAGFAWMALVDYLQHRFMHTRLMWPLHKSHHAPTEFTVVSGFRSHPFDYLFAGVASSAGLALVGVTLETVFVLQIVAFFNPMFTHSNLTCLAALERFGVVTPAGHRLHHGIEPRYHDRNFGNSWNVWDRVFGTYVAPPADIDEVAIGVDDGEQRHNTGRPLRAMAAQTVEWMRVVGAEARRLGAGRPALGRSPSL